MEYLQNIQYAKEKVDIYTEGIYNNPIHNAIHYDREEKINNEKDNQIQKNQIID